MLGVPALPAAWGPALQTATRGNPLHLEELIAERVVAGALQPGSDAPEPDVALGAETISGKARDLLAARLEALPDASRTCLQAAAIAGDTFAWSDVEELLDDDRLAQSGIALELLRDGLLERAVLPGGTPGFRFAPPVLARVAREGLADDSLASYHRRRAAALETRDGDVAALAARHWLAGGEPERALPHLESAAVTALRRGAAREAISHLDRAIQVLRQSDETGASTLGRLFERRGQARAASGDRAGAEEDFRWMLAGAEKDGDTMLAARAEEHLASALLGRGSLERSLEVADAALARFDELGDTRGGARALVLMGRALAALGRREEAAERLRSAETQAERIDDQGQLVRVLLAQGELPGGAPTSPETLERYRRALDVAGRLDDPGLVLEARLGIGSALVEQGRYGDATEYLEAAAGDAEHRGDVSARLRALSHLGVCRDQLGDPRAATDTLETALELARRAGDLAAVAATLEALAGFHLRRGRPGRALEAAQGALRWARRTEDAERQTRALLVVGASLREVGDRQGARGTLDKALDLSREARRGALRARTLLELGALALSEGESDAAKSFFQEACFLARRRGDRDTEGGGMVRLAEAYLLGGDHQRAGLALGKGRDLLAGTGPAREIALGHLVAARLESSRPGGDRERARDDAEAALTALEEVGEGALAWEADHLLGRLLLDAGQREEAIEHYRRAFLHLDGVAARLPERFRADFRDEPRRRAFLSEWEKLGARPGTARVDRQASDEAPGAPSAPRERDLERLLEINKKLNSALELRPLLETLVDTAVDLTGADRGLVLLSGGSGLELELGRARGGVPLPAEDHEWSHSLAARVSESGEPLLSTDVLADERFTTSRSVRDLGLRSVMAVPLRSRGEIAGALVLESRESPATFDAYHLQLLLRVGDQAGLALANARMVEELRHKREEIERLNAGLRDTVDRQALDLENARIEILEKQSNLELRYRYDRIIGAGPAMQRVYAILDKVVPTRIPVLITGESGTGKELIARAIHYNGARKSERFTTVNCAAVTETLLESELFGHQKGAFTGADRNRQGLFTLADGGTLFLDEVGDMSLPMQAKLLRALQDGEVRPVGSQETLKVDVRVISATNRDLKAMVKEKTFREDLFYRLNVASIHVPALRERKEDLGLLVDHFLERYEKDHEGPDEGPRRRFDGSALRLLALHDWPGNVRELEHEVTKLAAFSAGEIIDEREVMTNAGFLTPSPGSGGAAGPVPVASLEELEKQQVRKALDLAGGNRTRAAGFLGINRATLHRKIRKYGLD
jgi:transcriptional regulator with GAF, ATPase, and Fis domain